MIYKSLDVQSPLSQGDIINRVPLIYWDDATDAALRNQKSIAAKQQVIVLTQACDLAHTKTERVQVAPVHAVRVLVEHNILKPHVIRDQVRRHRVYGWYFLPASGHLDESVVDLRELHTIPRKLFEELIAHRERVCRLTTPYREHLAQQFSLTYARIALPEAYETLP